MATGYPERYVVFDTESTAAPAGRRDWDMDQRLRLGVAKVYDPAVVPDGRPLYAGFRSRDEFSDVLGQMPLTDKPIYVFAHNIAYDMRIVRWFELVTMGQYSIMPPPGMPGAGRYKRPLFVLDGSPVICRFFRADGQRFLFLDSYNWFRLALAQIGDMIGHPKAQMPPVDAPDEDWHEYCQVDVDVLDHALRHLWGWLGCLRLPGFDSTPASQAASIYRQRYARGRVKRPEDTGLLKLDRLAYYGGLTEAFFIGRYEKQSYYVDVNSLYPHVMANNPYPCELVGHGDSIEVEALAAPPAGEGYTAEVWLDSADTCYPVRGRDRTLWVTGRVRTVLAGPELREAIDAGHVVRAGRWRRYRLDDLFSGYVKTFWGLRHRALERKDLLTEMVCKCLLNSLHGKFGQRDGEWQYAGRTETAGTYTAGRLLRPEREMALDVRVLDGHFFTRHRDSEHEQSFVPIAAWTASYARIFMDQVRHAAGADDVLYQAVDGLIVTQDGYDRLNNLGVMDTGKIGDLKTVDSYSWLTIANINQFDHDHGFRHSGIPRKATPLADGVYEYEEWETGAGAIFGGRVDVVSTRTVYRRPSGRYTRRTIGGDGRTSPQRIDNWSVPPEIQLTLPAGRGDHGGE